MKVLSIGNSFSQDAHRYLHALAKAEGEALKTVNLYIGGCSLRRHYLNLLDDVEGYNFEFNGENTGLKVSIREALVSDDWDVVTLQQVSAQSPRFETYTPYLEELSDYVRTYCPHAKQMIHQTWAYENGSQKLESMGFDTDEEMFAAIEKAYQKAADTIGADGIIPAGKAMLQARKLGLPQVHRDTYHASWGAGRYLLALCWLKYLTGRDITQNAFSALDVPMTEEERKIVIAAVNAAL